ncbi:hypothetical protein CXF83_09920 [Shewanella sp. Choline-02u-19]|uniref:hypothetical protein n=1 Tax=unclassified Shewanella TaxID=196818 RepID=UPI000C32596B|nr:MULTISPECIES: hypothetical protein [unclassified Shewanella]PKH62856.1 hypothetical protein CXF84_00780 [Shewanella sp. Bg11-22]PKI27021.1 hypothetical protein CXF83_09920 [Shewanella sp. Choline-02u-19]
MDRIPSTIDEALAVNFDNDDFSLLMSVKRKKLQHALEILLSITQHEQSNINSEDSYYDDECEQFYFRVHKCLLDELEDPLEMHILMKFVHTYIGHM